MSRWLIFICLWSPFASAGFVEIGATGNYRISRLDSDNYQEMVSYTGSISYYFWEMSALELSYTEGRQVVVVKVPNDPTDNKTTITTTFQLAGLDLVLTLANKQSTLQPYVKLGGAYMHKEFVREVETLGSTKLPSVSGVVPSAGLGFKVKITDGLSFKVGVDAWTSPPDKEPVIVDYAGRAGVSWMF